jgi:hypothetical protein
MLPDQINSQAAVGSFRLPMFFAGPTPTILPPGLLPVIAPHQSFQAQSRWNSADLISWDSLARP